MTATDLTIDVHLQPDDVANELERDVRVGLAHRPRSLSPKWFYDERGSNLFDAITRLPEYYQTRTERALLAAQATPIAKVTGARTLVELGSGTSEKTRLLLDALHRAGTLRSFIPLDVSAEILRSSAAAIARRYPDVAVHAVVGDFQRHLHQVPGGEERLVAFLGGTIGNLEPERRAAFLQNLRATLHAGDWVLLGADTVKDPARLLAAYDDRQGVTAEFNRNVLRMINRELGADFQPGAFRHVVRWDGEQRWIEMRLRSEGRQRVRIDRLGLDLVFEDGEEILTEVSAKFTSAQLQRELAAAGFAVEALWTDARHDFLLVLAAPMDLRVVAA